MPSDALFPLSLPLVSLCLSLAYCSEVMQVHCSWPPLLLLLLLLDEATIDLDLEGEAGVERELCLVLLRIREWSRLPSCKVKRGTRIIITVGHHHISNIVPL